MACPATLKCVSDVQSLAVSCAAIAQDFKPGQSSLQVLMGVISCVGQIGVIGLDAVAMVSDIPAAIAEASSLQDADYAAIGAAFAAIIPAVKAVIKS